MIRYSAPEFGAPLVPVESEPVELGPEDVLVRVDACGVCHTDLHTWEGSYDLGGGRRLDLSQRVRRPLTPGHEIAGVVVAAGRAVLDRSPGMRCVVYPWIGCGACSECRRGRDTFCASPRYLGVDRPGGFAEQVVVPHGKYVLPIGDLEMSQAALLGCSGLTAYSALRKLSSEDEGPLLVLGAGGVGLTVVALACSLFGREVIAVDVAAEKLDAACALGARHGVLSGDAPRALEELRLLSPQGLRSAIDTVGNPATFDLATASLAKGGRYVIVGLYGGATTLSLPLLPAKQLSLLGSMVGSLEELTELVSLARQGRFPPIPLTRRPLADAYRCLCDLRNGKALGRYVLTPSQD